MKSARVPAWAFVGLILCLAIHYGVSCDTRVPTQPSPESDGPNPVAEPAPSGGQPGVSQSPGSEGAGALRASLSSATTETEWCADFVNDSANDEWGTAACYEDPTRALADQTLFHSDQRRLRPGETARICANKPCGQWQCDAVNLRGVPPKTNPEFGSNLLLGRIGRNSDDSCKPPTTTTTPVCVPEGEGDGYNCVWNTRTCRWDCQTCEQANPPGVSGWEWNVTDTHVRAELICENAAECSITIWAGNENNPFRYRKDHEAHRGVCGRSERVSVSYRHERHGSCLWTLIASGPGLNFNQEVIDRCD